MISIIRLSLSDILIIEITGAPEKREGLAQAARYSRARATQLRHYIEYDDY